MKRLIKELIPYILIFIVVLMIRTFIFTPVRVNGDSMVDTLVDGDILILKKYDTSYERLDIVVLNDNYTSSIVIKRIIGLPGEEIEIENGAVYINKKKIDDIYNNYFLSNMESIILEEDEYFVMGDNRAVSLDSRAFGPVKESDMMGTVTFGIYPFGKIE
ncbi:MAG: signal peptidase I [bacterium]